MRNYKEYTILNAKATTGIGNTIDVKDYRHVILSLATASSANLTVKFAGSISGDAPTFSAAQSVSNHWDYIEVKDLQDGSAIDGDVGIAPAGTDDFRLLEMNTNGLNWINANVTARAAGSVTIKVVLYND
jgi:hypothetical protein